VDIDASVIVLVTGLQATASVGSVVAAAGADVYLVGVSAQGQIGSVLVWSVIDDNQTPNWQNVDDSQSGNWVVVNDGNTVTWTQVLT
jgi:hypothetical protein